ncbi:MAG: hypothetical protein AB1505_18115 [Candidatus Latescibacterota bacterium]
MGRSIEGKVAAVIDDTTLVLNVGHEQGVREGMVFAVYGEHHDIRDPDTGEALGRWEMVKARVVVTHVQPRMSTARAPAAVPERAQDGTRPLSAVMVEHSLGQYGRGAAQWERLPVRAADIRGRPQSQPIAVGDGARSLVAEAEPGPEVPAPVNGPEAPSGP